MRIRDTLSGADVEVGPRGRVGIYVCGATVYDDAHVGHARSAIVFDVLRRHLEVSGAQVVLVQNFTDVDDKILERASQAGRDPAELAESYIARYIEDSDALNIMRPTHAPRATENIREMIGMIGDLVEAGAAYATQTGVYFDVSGFARYGRLSGKRTDELVAGARVAPDPSKRGELDFALWKRSDAARAWDSPWGRGRPGWHIECSAMAKKYLQGGIDIHGGGRDLIFPHHENEIAQSESCGPAPLARSWMHVGMVTVDGEKMSKSAGNSRSVRAALGEWGANALRVFCLGAHYSKPIDYSEAAMAECAARWEQAETCHYELRGAGAEGGAAPGSHDSWKRFAGALDDNCDTRGALDALFGLAGEVNEAAASGALDASRAAGARGAFDAMMGVMGLRVRELAQEDADRLDGMASERARLRAESRYQEADGIRDAMISRGIDVLDHGGRTVWVAREGRGRDPARPGAL